jgi:hypothetical protein
MTSFPFLPGMQVWSSLAGYGVVHTVWPPNSRTPEHVKVNFKSSYITFHPTGKYFNSAPIPQLLHQKPTSIDPPYPLPYDLDKIVLGSPFKHQPLQEFHLAYYDFNQKVLRVFPKGKTSADTLQTIPLREHNYPTPQIDPFTTPINITLQE